MITATLIAILLFFLTVYGIVSQGRPYNYPPGPKWWPFLGNGLMLRKLAMELKGQHKAFIKLADDYGTPVLGLRLGGEYVVVACSAAAAREVLTRDEFVGRPDSYFMRLRCFGKREGVTGADGPLWQNQRAFLVRHLKLFGFGKTTMEDLIREEVRDLINLLKKERKPLNISELLAPTILSVLWGLVAGKCLKRTDEQLTRLLKLMSLRSRAFDMAGGYLNQFPWLRFLAPEKTGYSILAQLNSELKQFLTDLVDEHKKSYKPDVTRDLIDAFLHEINLRVGGDDNIFTESQLIVVLLDLFIAGSQTTSATLDFCFLYMLKYPEVQEKVCKCLEGSIGEDAIPSMADKSRLAYVEAVIAEVQRMCDIVPVCGPRRCLKNTELAGYFIPKNATILISLWSIHKDPNLFPDPKNFSPERFLYPDGTFIRNPNLLPFGLGKRRCLGDILAKACIFMIFSGLMRHFNVSKPELEPEPSLEPLFGITLAPQKYKAEFIPRLLSEVGWCQLVAEPSLFLACIQQRFRAFLFCSCR